MEKLLAVEKPMHNVIYVQCRMWGCGMTVFPLSALLRLELPVHHRKKYFMNSLAGMAGAPLGLADRARHQDTSLQQSV